MELRPDINKLMRRDIYTFLTITLVTIISFLIIHILVVTFNQDVTNTEFVRNVWPWVAGSLACLWVFAPGLIYLWIINLRYSIEDERLVIQKGILTKKNISIPYSAVTDFTLSRSLYERWLNIGTLLVQTAGQGTQTGMPDGKLEGLTDFDALHTTLRAKVKAYRGSSQDETASTVESDAGDAEVLQSILEEVKRINHKLN